VFKSWPSVSENYTEGKYEEEGKEAIEQENKSEDTKEASGHEVNSLWDISYKIDAEDEYEDVEEIHLSQNAYNTRSETKASTSDTTSNS